MPAFAPARGASPQHFFYLLPDDLQTLRGFLVNGIERTGQWKTVAGSPLAERLCSRATTAEEVSLRVELLMAFCELWSVGRGRPVGPDALAQSGALRERYLNDVAAIALELEGDAVKLLDALRARETKPKGFRKATADALEEYFREAGYLDSRSPYSESELRTLALARPAARRIA